MVRARQRAASVENKDMVNGESSENMEWWKSVRTKVLGMGMRMRSALEDEMHDDARTLIGHIASIFEHDA
jgi:hypothetical protein